MAVQTRLFLPFMPNVQYANLKCTLASFAELLTRRMPDKVSVVTERTAKEFDFRFDASGIEQGKNPATVRFYLDDVHFSSIEFEDYGNGIVKAAMTADVSISYAKPVFVGVILPFIEDLFIKEAKTLAKNEQNDSQPLVVERLKSKPKWTEQDWRELFESCSPTGSRPDYYELERLTGKKYSTIREMYSRLYNRN